MVSVFCLFGVSYSVPVQDGHVIPSEANGEKTLEEELTSRFPKLFHDTSEFGKGICFTFVLT